MIQNKDYDEIMNELGFVHQHCIFHLYKNILKTMQSEINKTIKNYKQELKIKHPKRSMIIKEGIYTQGIYRFINMLNKIKTEYESGYMTE